MPSVQGKLIEVMEVRSGLKKNGEKWYAQEYVLEYNKYGYVKNLVFSIMGADRINSFASLLKVGREIIVNFDVEARKSGTRWFNTVNCWKVESANGAQPRSQEMDNAGIPAPEEAPAGDQMPF